MKTRKFLFLTVLVLLPTLGAADDVVLIANPSVPASAISEMEVMEIFLGDKIFWDDGRQITFVTLKGDTHKAFLKQYIHRTDTQFSTHWRKQVFSGKGSFPRIFESEQAIVEFVARTAGAIGYVSAGTDVADVKKISVR